MSKIIFVTGTDTGVGKTVMTALLLHHLRSRGLRALAMKGAREKSLASGATDYVTKPVDTEHLIRLIAYYLGVSAEA